MNIDFAPFFRKYEELSAAADKVFERVKNRYPECVKCKVECSDCCHALFDLTLIEALYINYRFKESFGENGRIEIIDRSNRADREVYKVKRRAYMDLKSGKKEVEILMGIAKERIKCPLLNRQKQCDLYRYRPISCRLYGIPTSIGGAGYTCGMSGFVESKQYPTVDLNTIQNGLYKISAEFIKEIKSRHVKMADMLVPLSMALLTDYNEKYLGIAEKKSDTKKENEGEEDDQTLT